MLPLVTNITSGPQSAQPAQVQNVPLNALTDPAAASRTQLPVAVSATGAPAAFSPNVQQWRTQANLRNNSPAPQPAKADPLLLPSEPQPATITPPRVSQFTTQMFAQAEAPIAEQQAQAMPPRELRIQGQLPADTKQVIRDMRIAQGDMTAARETAPAQALKPAPLPAMNTAISLAVSSATPAQVRQIAVNLPQTAQFRGLGARKPTLSDVKGIGAYEMARVRSDLIGRTAQTDTTL